MDNFGDTVGFDRRRAIEAFMLAWQQPEQLRDKVIAGLCKDDLTLLRQIKELIREASSSSVGSSRTEALAWANRRLVGDSAGAARAPAAGSDAVAETKRVFGDFELLRQIEEGGMGTIWLAKQLSLGRTVALKTYKSHSEASEAARAQFLRAAQLAARLQHPHVVVTYNAGLEGDTLYYVMEYIEGVTLKRVIDALAAYANEADPSGLAALPPELKSRMRIADDLPGHGDSTAQFNSRGRQQAIRSAIAFLVEAFLPVLDAIQHAHQLDVIHGDIKPSNLMFDRAARLMVVDFGLARSISLADDVDESVLRGTAKYMSPEQVTGVGGAVNESTDVYALGATLYEILALKSAYDGPTRDSIIASIVSGRSAPVREVNPRVHRDLAFIVDRAMHRQLKRRYATAAEMAKDLSTFLARQPLSGRQNAALELLRRAAQEHPVASLCAGLLLTAVAATAGLQAYAWLQGPQSAAIAQAHVVAMEEAVMAARARAAGAVDSAGLAAIESAIESASKSMTAAKLAGLDGAGQAEHQRRLDTAIAEIRVRAYHKAGDEAHGNDFLAAARSARHDVTAVVAELVAAKALGELRVELARAVPAQVAVREVERQDNSTSRVELARLDAPATFLAMVPGEHVVEVAQQGHESIRFPVIVKRGVRTVVRLPVQPENVPDGMVYVPCVDEEDTEVGTVDEQIAVDTYGVTRVSLSKSFFLDRREVTNAQFAEFYANSRFLDLVDDELKRMANGELDDEVKAREEDVRPAGWMLGRPPEGGQRLPVRLAPNTTAVAAMMAYARYRDPAGELPEEYEWERAARGLGARVYPYGDEFVLRHHWSPQLTEVGTHPDDVSVYGVFDMLGSVFEVVRGPYGTSRARVVGGAHDLSRPNDCHLARNRFDILLVPTKAQEPGLSSNGRWTMSSGASGLDRFFVQHSGCGFRCRLPAPSPQRREESL